MRGGAIRAVLVKLPPNGQENPFENLDTARSPFQN